jgi:hypothetical protein
MSAILSHIAQSDYRKEALARHCRISLSKFSRIINGRVIPSKYEKIMLRNTFTKMQIMSERELLDSLAENAAALQPKSTKQK